MPCITKRHIFAFYKHAGTDQYDSGAAGFFDIIQSTLGAVVKGTLHTPVEGITQAHSSFENRIKVCG